MIGSLGAGRCPRTPAAEVQNMREQVLTGTDDNIGAEWRLFAHSPQARVGHLT
jgi:hypothetical protein